VAARVVLELAEMEPINVPEVADPHPIIAPLRSGRGSDKPSSKCPAIRQRAGLDHAAPPPDLTQSGQINRVRSSVRALVQK
jgi:hypothetical protein